MCNLLHLYYFSMRIYVYAYTYINVRMRLRERFQTCDIIYNAIYFYIYNKFSSSYAMHEYVCTFVQIVHKICAISTPSPSSLQIQVQTYQEELVQRYMWNLFNKLPLLSLSQDIYKEIFERIIRSINLTC